MDDPDPPVDSARCPLCGAANECALASAPSEAERERVAECWCVSLRIADETLARIPEAARRRACVCRRCASLR